MEAEVTRKVIASVLISVMVVAFVVLQTGTWLGAGAALLVGVVIFFVAYQLFEHIS